jgi:hypothetical protein
MTRRAILKFVPVVLIFLGVSVGAQPVYTWRDENGTLHFSDKPRHPSAERYDGLEGDRLQTYRQPWQPVINTRPSPQSTSTQGAPRHQVITAADYEINISASQRNRDVTVSGRIGNGPECKNLLVTIYIRDRQGRSERVSGTVSNVGQGRSDLLHVKKRVHYGDVFNHWDVLNTVAQCAER